MIRWGTISVALLALPGIAAAQGSITDPPTSAANVRAEAEIASDERRRGLSWSGGDVVLAGRVSGDAGALTAGLRLTTLRGSERHGDAAAVADLSLGVGTDIGALRIDGGATTHLFADARGRMDYTELSVAARYSYGPVLLDGGIDYAPDQAAIGGSNVYFHAGISSGIPTTPLTIAAAIGRSTGSDADDPRSDRLRPGGDYTDWRIGVEHVRGPLTLGIAYTGTDLGSAPRFSRFADRANSGDRLVASARLGL